MEKFMDYLNRFLFGVAYVMGCLFLAFLIFGCAPQKHIQYVNVELARDPRPVIDKIKDKEIECLSVPVHNKLYNEIMTLENYAVYLETIIDSTKAE